MKNLHSVLLYGAIFILAAGLTLASLMYIRPAVCERACGEPEGAPCPSGACRIGEQRAGFPLPVWIDDPGGGSPTSGWGKLGPEDPPNPLFFLADLLFYSILLWLVWRTVQLFRDRARPRALLVLTPLLVILAACLIVAFSIERSFAARSIPVRTGEPERIILGKWSFQDPSTGEEFFLRFYERGRVSLTLPGYAEQESGEYRWESEGRMRLIFQWDSPIQLGEGGLCQYTPSFIKDLCQHKLVEPAIFNPAAYPAPVQTSLAIQSRSTEIYPPPYPAPTSAPMIESRIDGVFEVEIDGDRLSLFSPSGTVQTFQRVTGN